MGKNETEIEVKEGDDLSYDPLFDTLTVNGTTYTGSSGTMSMTTLATNTISGNITGTSITGGGCYNTINTTIPGNAAGPNWNYNQTTWQPNGTFTFPSYPYGQGIQGSWNIGLPSSEELAESTTLYPTPLNVADHIHKAHYETWLALNPNVSHRFLALYDSPTTVNNVRQLCFQDAESYEDFRTFWQDYQERFDGKVLTLLYPEPKVHGAVHIIPCKSNDTQKQWQWIVENCKEPVRYGGGFWFFDSERDKSMFMLTWTE